MCEYCESISSTILVATATSIEGPKNNFSSFICSHSSTIRAKWVNIGRCSDNWSDKIVKKKKKKHEHFISAPSAALAG